MWLRKYGNCTEDVSELEPLNLFETGIQIETFVNKIINWKVWNKIISLQLNSSNGKKENKTDVEVF